MALRKFVALVRESGKENGARSFRTGLTSAEQQQKINLVLKERFRSKFEVVEWVFENGSGQTSHRELLMKAMRICAERGATLVTATVDRLARNVRTKLKVTDSVEVLFADFPTLDANNADGKIILSLFAFVAAWFSDKQSEKMKAVYAARRKKYEDKGKKHHPLEQVRTNTGSRHRGSAKRRCATRPEPRQNNTFR